MGMVMGNGKGYMFRVWLWRGEGIVTGGMGL